MDRLGEPVTRAVDGIAPSPISDVARLPEGTTARLIGFGHTIAGSGRTDDTGVKRAGPVTTAACSIGVPDPYRGETVKAYVVVKPGETLTADEVIQFSREKLAAYKAPKMVEFIDALPKSAVGKVLRKELKEMDRKKSQPKKA